MALVGVPVAHIPQKRAVGIGAVYASTSHGQNLRQLGDVEEHALIERFFDPHANSLADLVDARLHSCGRVTVIDDHFFPSVALPYEMHADLRRPALCIGVDPFHTPKAFAEDGSLRADAVLDGDPVTLLLVNFNRIRLLPALVSGKLLMFERKPWVIPRLMSCLTPT